MEFKRLFKKQTKSDSQEPIFNDEDIAVLAYMCLVCVPCVVKHGFIPRRFAYYIPADKNNLDIAKDLFKKNGINVHVHFSYMASSKGQNALRMNYRSSKNYEQDRIFFKEIRQKKRELFYSSVHEEEELISQKIAQLKEQRTK